ncbi:MAG: hypothetical protein KME29_16095 [Calothrix sp. FI2-JRJ7]|jgi:hypothetical protein|nr:hypothetical protein [Calothrix sp. FI2-JRJ7]
MNRTLEEALDETTTAERLHQLAMSGDKKVCAVVAQNPNTAPDTLLDLFVSYPVEVLTHILHLKK